MDEQRPVVAFALEQVLGHVSQAQMLKRYVPESAHFTPRFIDVTFYQEDGLVERLPLPGAARASLRARLEIQRALAGRCPDVFMFNTQKPALFCLDYMRRSPSVISLDVTPLQYDELGELYDHGASRLPPLAAAKHRWNRRIFRAARRIFPASNWVARSLIDDYGIPHERIRVIPPGVDVDTWRPRETTVGDWIRVLFVGGHFERKGGHTLLEWFRSSRAAGRCELHIVTRSDVPPSERVHVYGGMQNNSDDLIALAQSCEIFALPTKADCFSLASLEAMAAGLPVVVNAVGGIPDIFDDATAGFLLDPDDPGAFARAMDALVEDDAMRQRMGRAARARVESRFAASTSVREIVREIERILEEQAVHASEAAARLPQAPGR